MSAKATLHLQYGVNAFADDIYQEYQPLKSTAHYPDPLSSDLRRTIARYAGFPEDMVLCASGSDELIDIYLRLYKARIPRLKVVIAPPTYPQYQFYASRAQIDCILLPHERAAISSAIVKKKGGDPKDTVVLLDSPSNPSGEIISKEQFCDLLEAGFRVFADEAYYEFYGQTMAGLIASYPEQLVVSRSLSKFAAIAGSRIGYLVAAPEIVKEFRAQQLFFNINSEGQHRAQYALQHVNSFHKAIAEMRQTKQQVDNAISQLGAYKVYPSLDMYTIFKHQTIPTERLHQNLISEHNIHTMRFPQFKGQDVIRSAVLQMPLMKRLVDALQSYA